MPYANIGDIKLYYEIYGNELELLDDSVHQKPSLIVLHGSGTDHTFHVEFSRDCAAFAQVIFIDRRGCGRSIDENPAHWSVAQWAKDVHLFCEALGLEKPFVKGISLGGLVAMQFAIDYPQTAGGIILVDTEAYFNKEGIVAAHQRKGGGKAAELVQKFLDASPHPPEIMREFFNVCLPLYSHRPFPVAYFKRAIINPAVSDHFKAEQATFNCLHELHKITSPVLYLSNTTNPLHLLETAQETAQAMSNADVKFVSFPNCGFVQMDAKEAAIKEIQKFIQRGS